MDYPKKKRFLINTGFSVAWLPRAALAASTLRRDARRLHGARPAAQETRGPGLAGDRVAPQGQRGPTRARKGHSPGAHVVGDGEHQGRPDQSEEHS